MRATYQGSPSKLEDEAYLRVATQIQRWRDFFANVGAYLAVNAILIAAWLWNGRGFFWPVVSLLPWGLGLSAQHFTAVFLGQITDGDVRRELAKHQVAP